MYDYLKRHQDEYKKLEEILSDPEIRLLYPTPNPHTEFNNRTDRRQLTADITALKNSDIIQLYIMSDSGKGIKMATDDEYIEHFKREKVSVLKALKTIYHQLDKAKLDGQTRLALGKEKSIIESLIR